MNIKYAWEEYLETGKLCSFDNAQFMIDFFEYGLSRKRTVEIVSNLYLSLTNDQKSLVVERVYFHGLNWSQHGVFLRNALADGCSNNKLRKTLVDLTLDPTINDSDKYDDTCFYKFVFDCELLDRIDPERYIKFIELGLASSHLEIKQLSKQLMDEIRQDKVSGT